MSAQIRTLALIFMDLKAELHGARFRFPDFNSAHEGYAILLEEVDELWDQIKINQKKRDISKMRREALQVAAMAIRFILDCTVEGAKGYGK